MGPPPELHRSGRLPLPPQGGKQSVQHRIRDLTRGKAGLLLIALLDAGSGLHQRPEKVRVLQDGLHTELWAVQVGKLHPHGQPAAVGELKLLPLQHRFRYQLRHMAQDTLFQRDILLRFLPNQLDRRGLLFLFLKKSKHIQHPISSCF